MKDNDFYSLAGLSVGEYQLIRRIGAGTYGLIYLVEDIHTRRRFAAKMLLKNPPMKLDDVDANKEQIQRQFYQFFKVNQSPSIESLNLLKLRNLGALCPFLKEIAIHLQVMSHPNIALIHAVLDITDLAVVIVMDYFEQGDLFYNITTNQIFQSYHGNKQLLMKNVMLQLIEAVEFCASRGIYHCDLKPENIMVHYNPHYVRSTSNVCIDYDECRVVLIDFGLAMTSNFMCCNVCRGLLFYMAPERLMNYSDLPIIRRLVDLSQYELMKEENRKYDSLSLKYFPTIAGDIWSLGVLFINISCLRNPWPMALLTQDENTVFRDYMLHGKKKILSQILPISTQFNLLLDKIFRLDPNERINLPALRQEIMTIDLFHTYPLSPPSEPEVNLPEVRGDLIITERSMMEQCRHRLKRFSCPHHWCQEQCVVCKRWYCSILSLLCIIP